MCDKDIDNNRSFPSNVLFRIFSLLLVVDVLMFLIIIVYV